MKPAVINNTSETPTQTHHEQNNSNNQANNGQPNNDHSRRFPQFRQHGFGFDGPDGDVFADMGLRSRLNRMGHPFDWKRRGSGQGTGATADPYDRYFDDVDFPHFGSTWDAFGRMGKRSQHPHETNDRSGFFDYIPAEFRQHVPEHFGGYFRQHSGQPYMHQQHQQPAPPQQQASSQQQQPTHPQSSQPSGSKSNLCDAAIQTDDSSIENNGERKDCPNNTENADNRNGMNANQGSGTSTQTSPNYGAQHQAPPYGRQQFQQPYGQYQYSQSPKQNQYYATPPPHQPQQQAPQQPPPPPQQQKQQHQQPQQSQPTQQQQEGFVRTVPIVFEDGTPISRTTETSTTPPTTSQTGSNKPRPEPLNKESFASNQPIPSDQPIPCPPPASHDQQQTEQQHSDSSDAGSAPPQTPHTADCISKIQAIQRDVLDLMLAVEQFGGKRGDKDYAYLDEMLTRNLLKLDTIDTNGKDSIRMARKEAIKCIQTSIAVLEAKADLHLNEKRDSVDQTNQDPSAANNSETIASANPTATNDKPAEKMDIEQTNGEAKNGAEPNATDTNSTDIPKVENISIDEKSTNDTEKVKEKKEKTPTAV